VAKLADAPDLGSGAARRGGSSPFTRTKKKGIREIGSLFLCLQLVLDHTDGVCRVVNTDFIRTALYNLGRF